MTHILRSRTSIHMRAFDRGLHRSSLFVAWLGLTLLTLFALSMHAQVTTVAVQGRIYDSTGAAIPQAGVTAANAATGLTRDVTASATGDYVISTLPPGDYTVTAEKAGFQKQAKRIRLEIGAAGSLDFTLRRTVAQEVNVEDVGEVAEPTRTMISSVISQNRSMTCR